MEYIGLILTTLLLLLHHSSAAAHQQGTKMLKENVVVASQDKFSLAKMGLVHRDSSVAVDGRQGLEGRKMVVNKVLDMPEKGLNKASSPKKIPEETSNNVPMESLRGQQHQWKPQKGEVLVGKRGDLSEIDKGNRKPDEENDDEEVMQMMRRDYKQKNSPRRKPPINNHQLHH